MKRICKAFIAAGCAIVTAFGFAACDFGINSPKSAYQVAVENGFTGTEQEWLNSLKGSNGSDGSDLDIEEIYNAAVKNGYAGTFLEFLKEYLSVDVSENNNTDTIAHNMMSVVSVCCGFTVTTTIGGGFFGGGTTQTSIVSSLGSGVIVGLNKEAGNAYIVTNYHVVYDAESDTGISESIYLYLYGDMNTFDTKAGKDEENGIRATYVGGAMNYDIALLEVSGSSILMESEAEAAEIGDSDSLTAGEKVYAIGNPEGEGISVTEGIVSVDSEYLTLLGADDETDVTLRVIRTDAAINSGNSGGGLFDAQGRLIGITNAKRIDQIKKDEFGNYYVSDSVDNFGYALPITQVGYVVGNMLDNSGSVKKAAFGITVETTDSKAKINADGKAVIEEEVTVASVDSGSAAEGILQEGDILRTISLGENSVDITRRYQVIDFMLSVRQGDSVVVTVERDGKQKVLSVTFDNTSYFQTVA